jgi:hypothetical protein
MIEEQRENVFASKQKMLALMQSSISHLYKGLQVDSLEPIQDYYCDLSANDNITLFLKQQKKRNKVIRKEIFAYQQSYEFHLEKRRNRSLYGLRSSFKSRNSQSRVLMSSE